MLYDQCIIHFIFLLVNLWLDKIFNNITNFEILLIYIFIIIEFYYSKMFSIFFFTICEKIIKF